MSTLPLLMKNRETKLYQNRYFNVYKDEDIIGASESLVLINEKVVESFHDDDVDTDEDILD